MMVRTYLMGAVLFAGFRERRGTLSVMSHLDGLLHDYVVFRQPSLGEVRDFITARTKHNQGSQTINLGIC